MALVLISLGSNLGDREENLKNAVRNLVSSSLVLLETSFIYQTEPIGFDSPNFFLNACASFNCSLSTEELLELTQRIERDLGRTSKSDGNYEDRLIDIDIIGYDSIILSTENLTIPHPLFRERNFVLSPLNDVASYWKDPVTGRSVAELKDLTKANFLNPLKKLLI